jgi:hypothetical protein
MLQRRQGSYNAFKIDLARRAVIRALTQAAAGTRSRNPTRKSGERRPAMTSISAPPRPRRWRAKVTGAAKYAGEFTTAGLAHGSIVTSRIAKGRIARSTRTKRLCCRRDRRPRHQNRPRMASADSAYKDEVSGRVAVPAAMR